LDDWGPSPLHFFLFSIFLVARTLSKIITGSSSAQKIIPALLYNTNIIFFGFLSPSFSPLIEHEAP